MAFPYVGLKVEVTEAILTKDSTVDACRAVAFEATRQILSEHRAVMMEPLMKIEVSLPSHYLGPVLSDITGTRRGQVNSIDTNGTLSVIKAAVPLELMVGYSNHLRSITSGTGSFSLEFARY